MIARGLPPADWNGPLGTLATVYQTREYAEYLRDAGFEVWHAQRGNERLLLWSKKRFGLFESFSSVCVPPLSPDFAKELHAFLRGKDAKLSMHPLARDNGSLAEAGFKRGEWATFIIDLRKPKEQLWEAVDREARKVARRTLEKGVAVRPCKDEAEFMQYHEVMNENRRRNGLPVYADSRGFWELFRGKGLGEIFVAAKDGELLGGLGVSLYNGYANEWGAALSDKAREEKVYASDAIRWGVIEWAHSRGAEWYDLTGVNPEPRDEKERGIYRFKEKWGGSLRRYAEYSLSNPVAGLARGLRGAVRRGA